MRDWWADNTAVDWWAERPAADYVLSLPALLTHVGLVYVPPLIGRDLSALDLVGRLDVGQRAQLYALLASVTGILVGFATAALGAFYAAPSGGRVGRARELGGRMLSRNWLAVIRGPLLAVGVIVLSFVLEGPARSGVAGAPPPPGSSVARWMVEGAVLLIALRLARLVWLFSWTIRRSGDDDAIGDNRLRTLDPQQWEVGVGAGPR